MIKLALLIGALAAAIGAGCSAVIGRRARRKAIRTRATVRSFSPIGGHGQLAPEVEFTHTDGRVIRSWTQRYASSGLRVGDETEILYNHHSLWGAETWDVFILRRPDANPYVLYSLAAGFLTVAAVGLMVAAVVI
ncbi:MAG: hypothetical protein E7319_05745 [Clostridiales bacterium]|nr:hypothetical protein [Clostridiales bacterium]